MAGADWAIIQAEESSGGDLLKIRGEKFFTAIGNITPTTDRDDDSVLPILIPSGNAFELRRITRGNFLPEQINASSDWDNSDNAFITSTEVRLFSPASIIQAITDNASSTSGISEATATALIATWARATSPTGTVPSDRLALQASDIPDIGADKITSGTLNNDRLTLTSATIPVLPASKITTGELDIARIPDITASKLPFNIIAISESDYDALATKADDTLYVFTS